MAQLILAAAGAAIGGWLAPVGWSLLGMSGAQLGWAAGGMLGGALFAPDQPNVTQEGPRLTDLRVTSADYGTPIPIIYGTARVAGSIIWASDLMETRHEETSGGGGKGGGGGSVTQVSYTYAIHMDLLIAESREGTVSEVAKILRLWANGDLFYDATGAEVVQDERVVQPGDLRICLGHEDQTADSLEQAALGIDNVPAYRGVARVVVENFQLQKYGNRPPSITAEVCTSLAPGGLSDPVVLTSSNPYGSDAVTLAAGSIWWVQSNNTILRIDPATGATVQTISAGVTPYQPLLTDAVDHYVWGWNSTHLYRWNDDGTNQTPFTRGVQSLWIDPISGGLWVYNPSGTNWLYQVNKSTGASLRTINAGHYVLDAAFDPDGNVWFISGDHNLYKIDAGGTVTTFALGSTYLTAWITYDPDRGSMWISTGSIAGELVEFSLVSASVVRSVSGFPNRGSGTDTKPIYDSARKMLWRIDKDPTTNQPPVTLYGVSTDTITTIYTVPIDWYARYPVMIVGDHLYATGTDSDEATPVIWELHFLPAGPQPVILGDIVEDLCLRSGLESGDIDVSSLTDQVRGYIVGRQMSARAAIEPLQSVFLFDGVESDNKLKFVKRGSSPVATIADDDLGASPADGEGRNKVEITRGQELDLPREISMTFFDQMREYNTGIQYARRLTTHSEGTSRLDLPIVLTPDEAVNAANTHLAGLWTARDHLKWQTTWEHAAREPTDVITLTADGVSRPVRILKREDNDGWIGWEGCADEAGAYVQQGAGVPGLRDVSQTVVVVVPTTLEIMDLPVLLDSHEGLCLYLAAWGAAPGLWDGAGLYKSIDGGSSYQSIGGFTMPATAGTCRTVLGSGPSCVFDETGTVTVLLDQGTLDSTSTVGVLNGANACVIGDEVLQFRIATLTAPMTYVLSGLLRGRRGTEWAIGGHVADERFVLLRSSSVQRLSLDPAEIGATRKWKAVTVGQAIADVSAQDFTAEGRSLKPYAPVHLHGARDGSDNLTITWVRRARINASWRDVPVPMDEASEAYDVEIWTSGYGTLKRTERVTSPTYDYTAANQTTDLGSHQSAVAVRVYQISAVIGRGYKLEGTV